MIKVIFGVLIFLFAYLLYFFTIRPFQSTDNAYIQANTISIAAQVSGIVSKTYVQNNQYVKAGDLLFEIDPKPFVIEVQNAQAKLELMGNNVRKAAADVDQSAAILEQRKAELDQAQLDAHRIAKLTLQQAVPPETNDNAITRLKSSIAAVEAAQAQLSQSRIALGKLGADNEQIRVATAALDKAKLNLSYTTIYAPGSGQLSNYTVYRGQYVPVGYPQFVLISDNEFWVDANFKETQLNDVKAGQHAVINVDMYPDKDFKGLVESISGASGTSFSLLPPQNATGNWVKVTQRVPVKIIITDVDTRFPLKIGTSASVKIKVK